MTLRAVVLYGALHGRRGVCAVGLLVATVSSTAQPAPNAAPDACANAGTQQQINSCAHEAFLASQDTMAQALRRIEDGLPAPRRSAWRKVQKSWLVYRTEACRFESGTAAGGSIAPMLQSLCATRLTRQRVIELEQMLQCREGDARCIRPAGATR